MPEATLELVACTTKQHFRIGFQVPGKMRRHEQHIGQFFPGRFKVAFSQRRGQFVAFLVQFGQHRAGVRPVETDPCRTPLKFGGALYSGQGPGHAVQQRPARTTGLALLLLLPFPGLAHSGAIGYSGCRTKDMRMPAGHLGHNPAGHILKIEGSLFLGDAGVKHHLKQQVAQLLAQAIEVLPLDGINYLVGLLQGVGSDGLEALFAIPGTAGLRPTQILHQLAQVTDCTHRTISRLVWACGFRADWTFVSIRAMDFMILRVDVSGAPIRWIPCEEAACLYTRNMVAWTTGDSVYTMRGGWNRMTGSQSRLVVHSIIAVKRSHASQHIKRSIPPLNNRELFLRDGHLCMYCGNAFSDGQLTRDHVRPLSRGGRDRWTNVVAACKYCNTRKGNRSPEEAKMSLLAIPYAPNWAEFLALSNRRILVDQMEFLRSQFKSGERLLSLQ